MKFSRSRLAIGVLTAVAAAGLTACGGSSGGGGGGGGGGFASFQEEFSQGDNYLVIEAAAAFGIDEDTLAAITTEEVNTDFSEEFCTPADQCVTPADYFGAMDPDEATPWWEGWTYLDDDIDGNLPPGGYFHPLQTEIEGGVDLVPAGANDCANIAAGLEAGADVSIFGVTYPVCVIRDGDLDGVYTLTNDHIYLLDGTVQVGNGDVEGAFDTATVDNDVLTIEPGTMIFAISETAPSLVITRGSQIDATGTADLPIIFAAVDVVPASDPIEITGDITDMGGRGDWGSLVLSGYGLVNNGDDNDQTTTEAVPDGVTRWFGGTDNDDSSGTLMYVLLLETGEAFRPDEEVQGLTIEASGGGTVISHVQITNSDDDGVEWFGGAASADHLVIQGVSDDSLDIDLGYQGAIQYALVIQGEAFGNYGIESDSNGDNFAAEPRTLPIIANLTILGNFGNGGAADADTAGALHREGFGGQVYRSVYSDDLVRDGAFDLGCLDVDSELPDELFYGDVIFNCSPNSLVNDTDS